MTGVLISPPEASTLPDILTGGAYGGTHTHALCWYSLWVHLQFRKRPFCLHFRTSSRVLLGRDFL
jgi:hypothetical protein